MIAMKLLIFVTEFYWFRWRLSSMLLLLLYRKMYFIWFWSHKNQFKIGHNFECYSTNSFVFVESFSFWLMIPKYKSWEQIMWCTPCVCSFLIHFKWNWSELGSCTRKQRNWTDLQVKESTTEQCYGVKKSVVGRCLSPPSTFQCFLWHNSTDLVFGCTFTFMRASTHTMLPSSTCIMYEQVHVWSLANVIFSVELSLETVRRIPLLHSVQLPFSLPRFACLFGNCSIYLMCTPQFLCSAWVCCWVFGTL